MKKITKTLTASLLAAAATANIFAVPASHVAYAETANQEVVKGDVISVKSIPSSGRVGYPIVIPKMEAKAIGGGATTIDTITSIKPIVTRPDGKSVEVTEATGAEEGWTFTPSVSGTYKLVYEGTNTAGVKTVSEVFSIRVTKETYDMSIEANSSIIIPSTVDTNKDRFTGGVIKEITLPHPIVKDKNDFVIFENGKINDKITRYVALEDIASKTTEEEEEFEELVEYFAEYSLTSEEINVYAGCTMKVTVATETKTYDSTATDDTKLQQDGTEANHYFFRPEQGTNVIHYVLLSSKGTALQSLTRTVLGSNTYDHTAIKLGFSAADRPTTASLNDKVRLPLASGYNKSDANSAVNVETIIKVNLVEGTEKTAVDVLSDEDGMYFVPTVKEGDYEIIYNVRDYYGNEATAYSYRIENVVDGKAPTMYIVNAFDYTTTADAIIAMQNAEYMIPTKVGRSAGEIVFPAMFGKDSVVAYENLTFYRTITSTNLDYSVNLLDTQYLKAIGTEDVTTLTSNAQKAAHEAVIHLDDLDDGGKKKYPAGDYTVTYTVRDGSGYSASKSFNFTIEEEFEDTVKPVVTYADNFPTLVQKGQDVSFAKPTITDTVDGSIKINYYVTVAGVDHEIFEKDGTITFNMNDYVESMDSTIYDLALSAQGKNTITVKTVAVDDHNNTTEEKVDIIVRNADDTQQIVVADSVAGDFAANELPTITNTYKQGSVVTVAGATFTDNDANLSIIVTVRDADGNRVTGVKAIGAIEKKASGDNTVYAHPGVKFTATKAQSYTVTYTAIDAGNNVVAYTVKLPTMADSESPVIVGVTSGKLYEIELGQKLDLGRVTVVDNVDEGLTPTISCEAHPEYVNGTIFAPTEVGTYTVKYTAKDTNGNKAESVLVEVKVTDKTKPILTINNKESYPTTMKEQTNVTSNSDFVAIELPSFSAEDETFDFINDAGALNMSVNAKIEISAPDGKTYTVDNTNEKYNITYDATKDVYKFVPTTKGTYTVKYTAVDASGNEAEAYTITVMVGDTVLPTVDYTGELNANLKVGDVVKIHEDKIVVTDNIIPTGDEELTFTSITLEDASGNTIDYEKEGENEDIRAYTFETAGTYTLTIVGRDVAGNTNTYVYKFNVTTDASTSSFKDNATGVVLIVVSLLILAGVIIYFARSKKTTSPKKTVKKVEKKETKEEVKEENKD